MLLITRTTSTSWITTTPSAVSVSCRRIHLALKPNNKQSHGTLLFRYSYGIGTRPVWTRIWRGHNEIIPMYCCHMLGDRPGEPKRAALHRYMNTQDELLAYEDLHNSPMHLGTDHGTTPVSQHIKGPFLTFKDTQRSACSLYCESWYKMRMLGTQPCVGYYRPSEWRRISV